ncbi:MAG: sensor domain-containing diguanylate cyclase [Desulfobacteraceae bacterium]|nr:MAG: sensor domain-containing diguanylate cyclase [Desulfobacteraceae bacterium]
MDPQNDLNLIDMLRQIGRALTSTLDVDKILNLIMDDIGTVYQPENWSLLLVDEKKQDLYFAIAVGPVSRQIREKRLALGQGVAGWTALHGETVVIPDVYADKRFAHAFDLETGFKTESIVCVPMICRNRTMGVIEIVNISADRMAQANLKILESLADFAAIAIENARYLNRIEQLSIHDDCTALYNARHLYKIIDQEIERWEKNQKPFSVVFFDMDYFKSVNDTHGHLIGSGLLRRVGDLLLNLSRPLDRGVRYGGDEFVWILPNTDPGAALQITRILRNRLRDTTFFQEQGLHIKIAASFGIAAFPEHAHTPEGIIKMADDAMYFVKEHNRDGICLSGQGLVT